MLVRRKNRRKLSEGEELILRARSWHLMERYGAGEDNFINRSRGTGWGAHSSMEAVSLVMNRGR